MRLLRRSNLVRRLRKAYQFVPTISLSLSAQSVIKSASQSTHKKQKRSDPINTLTVNSDVQCLWKTLDILLQKLRLLGDALNNYPGQDTLTVELLHTRFQTNDDVDLVCVANICQDPITSSWKITSTREDCSSDSIRQIGECDTATALKIIIIIIIDKNRFIDNWI